MGASAIIKIVVAIAIIGVITGFIIDYKMTKEKLETKKAELLAAYEQIKSQNDAIKKLEVDVETYKEKKPQIVEKVITKYQDVKVTDETCEAKLEALSAYAKLFYDRNNNIVNQNYFNTTTQNPQIQKEDKK